MEEPPPRPYKSSYDDGFVPVSPRNDLNNFSRPSPSSHGSPMDDRPPHAPPTPRSYADHPPPVLLRQDLQGKIMGCKCPCVKLYTFLYEPVNSDLKLAVLNYLRIFSFNCS